jgi:hypothetical protein
MRHCRHSSSSALPKGVPCFLCLLHAVTTFNPTMSAHLRRASQPPTLACLQDRSSFFSKYWEQQPAVFKATPARIALFQGLCTFPSVINWLKQREKKLGPLEFGVDVNAARYQDGTRETPNGEVRHLHQAASRLTVCACCVCGGGEGMHKPPAFSAWV